MFRSFTWINQKLFRILRNSSKILHMQVSLTYSLSIYSHYCFIDTINLISRTLATALKAWFWSPMFRCADRFIENIALNNILFQSVDETKTSYPQLLPTMYHLKCTTIPFNFAFRLFISSSKCIFTHFQFINYSQQS